VEKAARERFGNWREAKAWIAENAGGRAAGLRVANGEEGTPRIVPKPNRVAAATARAGYTLVLTRGREQAGETAEAVLRDYRARDLAEKLFDAFKHPTPNIQRWHGGPEPFSWRFRDERGIFC
jgi:hypothetical protein